VGGSSLPVEAIHDLLAFADCYVGDSQTMATEAALLGTPAVRTSAFVGDDDMSNFRELETEYGLLQSFADEDAAIDRAVAFLKEPPREGGGARASPRGQNGRNGVSPRRDRGDDRLVGS